MGSNSPAGRLTYKQLVRHVVGLNAAPGQAIKLQPEDMIDHGDFVADQVACADRISAIYLGYLGYPCRRGRSSWPLQLAWPIS